MKSTYSIFLSISVGVALCASAEAVRVMTSAEFTETYHANVARSFSQSLHRFQTDHFAGAPGFGYSGTILPYEDTPGLRENRERYKLSAGWFVRDTILTNSPEGIIIASGDAAGQRPPLPNRLPFLLFSPNVRQAGTNPVPLIVFMPGNGELGNDLNAQFRQQAIFETVTSSAFQARRPCYLLVPSVPKMFGTLKSPTAHRPSPIQNLLNDTILGVALAQQSPPVDTNRLYATGLSFGGSALYDFGRHYPGRYAALVPVAGHPADELAVHPTHPGRWWEFHNEEKEGKNEQFMAIQNAFKKRVVLQGGEFRVGTFPDRGHDAWSKAWREEAVWEWMFSKTADGSPALNADGGKAAPGAGLVSIAAKPLCTASVKGKDGKSGPERGADGLMATAYVSSRGLKAGEYWQAEFPEPVKGRLGLTFGNPDGSGAPTKARVNISEGAEFWTTVLPLNRGRDFEAFRPTRPVRFVRIISTAPDNAPEELIVRELVVE